MTIDSLKQYLDNSPSAYHAVAALEEKLDAAGYTRLHRSEGWKLVPGGKYYVDQGGSALFAFRIPQGEPAGFMMSAAHCDRPTFKVKENGTLCGKYTRVATEKYGGMLISTWLDRPLSVAGRVLVETENGVQTKLVDIDKDLLMIPNVSIHMNRGVNDGYKWNPAVDTLPLMGCAEAGKLDDLLAEAADGKILGHDLFLYVRQKAALWGAKEEFISAQGLDDLACVWGCAEGFMNAEDSAAVPVLCVFDNEEIGSGTLQGAGSTGLIDVLERICRCQGWELNRLLATSFMVSADNAHALHPNHPELSDAANAPVLGGGVVVKFHGDHRYTTDGMSAALFRKLSGGVPLQTFYNRADMPSGSTLGTISVSQVAVMSVDIGLPQLAMHSCYETAAVKDAENLALAMQAYYSKSLEAVSDEGFVIA